MSEIETQTVKKRKIKTVPGWIKILRTVITAITSVILIFGICTAIFKLQTKFSYVNAYEKMVKKTIKDELKKYHYIPKDMRDYDYDSIRK